MEIPGRLFLRLSDWTGSQKPFPAFLASPRESVWPPDGLLRSLETSKLWRNIGTEIPGSTPLLLISITAPNQTVFRAWRAIRRRIVGRLDRTRTPVRPKISLNTGIQPPGPSSIHRMARQPGISSTPLRALRDQVAGPSDHLRGRLSSSAGMALLGQSYHHQILPVCNPTPSMLSRAHRHWTVGLSENMKATLHLRER